MLCPGILTLAPLTSPRRMALAPSQFMIHSGRFVCTVCDKWHVRQVNCSPSQAAHSPTSILRRRIEHEAGRPSPFIFDLVQMKQNKMHYTVGKTVTQLSVMLDWFGSFLPCLVFRQV